MQTIHVTIRAIGSSKVVVLPKPILALVGLDDVNDAELYVDNGVIVLRKAAKAARAGWGQAAQEVAAASGNALVMGEVGNEADGDLAW